MGALSTWKTNIQNYVKTTFDVNCYQNIVNILSHPYISDNTPYTIIVSSDEACIVLKSAILPSTMKAIVNSSIPTHDEILIRVSGDDNNIRIGRSKIDLDSFIVIENMVLYSTLQSKNQAYKKEKDKAMTRGSISKFTRRIELQRLLSHR